MYVYIYLYTIYALYIFIHINLISHIKIIRYLHKTDINLFNMKYYIISLLFYSFFIIDHSPL